MFLFLAFMVFPHLPCFAKTRTCASKRVQTLLNVSPQALRQRLRASRSSYEAQRGMLRKFPHSIVDALERRQLSLG